MSECVGLAVDEQECVCFVPDGRECFRLAPGGQEPSNGSAVPNRRRRVPRRMTWRRSHDCRKSTKSRLPYALLATLCACEVASLGSTAHPTATRAFESVKERPLLLYIPMHVSEPVEHLQELCDRTLSKNPWIDDNNTNLQLAFDILLVVSGPSDASRDATEGFEFVRSMLEEATRNVSPSPPRIFLDYKTLVGVDRYNLNLDEEDKDAEWVSGPNSVFYDAFAEGGEIYEKYVQDYALVQQLETDVVALRGGWLSALVQPMLEGEGLADSSSTATTSSNNNSIIMSGSTIKSSCSYVVKFDECQPFEEEAKYMIEHINGNAMYRVGETLQRVLKASREQFKNAEQFDLAMYHVFKASNATSLAHSNPLYHNMATLLDREWFTDVRYYGVNDLAVVHAPRRLRADGLKAVATRAQTYLPATTVVLSKESTFGSVGGGGSSSSSSSTLLRNFKATADAVRLSGVIYVATSEEVFFEASRVVALQVLPAFEQQQRRRNGNGDDDDEAAAAAAAAEGAAAASVDPKSLILTWPPTSSSPSMRLLSTITQLVAEGYSPLVVDASSTPLQTFDMVLYGFPKDAIYFLDAKPLIKEEERRPLDESQEEESGSAITIETMFVPASAYTAKLLQAWAVTVFQRETQKHHHHHHQQKAPPAHLTLAEIKALASCRLETTMSVLASCPWRGVGVETLPIHWFSSQLAFFGSGWTKRARRHAFFLDMSSGGGGGGVNGSGLRAMTTFRLRHSRTWHWPARCPTYSVLSRLPRDLTHETVLNEIALHSEFLSFVRENKIACAVLPGFRIPSTSATLPVDALLDLEALRLLAGANVTILPRVQDVEDASVGYVAYDHRGKARERKTEEQTARRTQHSRQSSSPTTTLSPRGDDLCSRFYSSDRPGSSSSSPTSCLAKDVSRALEEARSRLPPSNSYVCAFDFGRSVEEVALAGLRGPRGLTKVAGTIERSVRRTKLPSTILLAGAWRLLPRGSFSSRSDDVKPLLNIVTLADLHSHDQGLQSAQELNPKPSPLVDEAWTGILEALLCFYSGGIEIAALDLSRQRQLSSASKAASKRRKSKMNYAELVARHIPPSILLEDVTAFAKWLARPDRPKLVSGRSLQALVSDGHHQNRHKAALDALDMIAPAIAETKADYAFLPAAADPTTGALLPWSSVTDISEIYRARPTLLPPSLAAMMHPLAVFEFLLSPESSTLPLIVKEKGLTNDESSYHDDDEMEDFAALEAIRQSYAFRTTVAALAKQRRQEKKKLWLLPSVGPSSRDTMSVSSMGTSDDVVVRIP